MSRYPKKPMLRRPACFVAAVALAAGAVMAQEVTQSPLPSSHPLVGIWRIDLPNGCFEEYELRADGTKLSQSGEERNESIFQISTTPSTKGFYRWADKITKGNGKPDCGGSVSEVGHVAINFVRLHPSGTRFLLCGEEAMSSCFGEFKRVGRGA